MHQTDCEHALARVIAYLSRLGIPLSRELSAEALALVGEALTSNEPDIYAYVMKALPERFSLPPLSLPRTMPPIHRGSIGYGDHA